MKTEYQLLVVGAGPAGMAAASTAAEAGLQVALVDEQPRPGGQIYRNLDSGRLAGREFLGGDYLRGLPLLESFRRAQIDYFPGARVWYLDSNRELGILLRERHYRVSADAIVIAAGARERPLPFPGWQLPGVMTAGAAQILLKSAALVPDSEPLLAGSGPLLLLLACQYLNAGVRPRALVETAPAKNLRSALRYLPRALSAGEYLHKGIAMTARLHRARIPWYRGSSGLRALGENAFEALEFEHRGIRARIEAGLLLVHHGVVPATELAAAGGCELEWSEAQQSWRPCRDDWGETSRAGIFVAGDMAGIRGAQNAELEGRLAALQGACSLGRIDAAERDRRARRWQQQRKRHLAVRPFLDTLYRIPDNALDPADETIVCRCEEIDAGAIRAAAAIGGGPNQVKAFTRCGMGPCQGRSCSATLERICALARGIAPASADLLRVRPPLKPITLGQLARGVEEDR